MDRRGFLKLSALAGLSLGLPLWARRGVAQSEGYDGPYWILVNASGGWDPRLMFDPTTDVGQNRIAPGVEYVGNIPYAPTPIDLEAFGVDTDQGYEAYLMSNRAFLETWGSRLTVLNGVDTSTNNHDAGNRTVWSGTIPGTYPAFGALVAAARAPEQPIAFLSGGGYDATAGLVPLARVSNPNTLGKIAFFNHIDPNNAETDFYHTNETMNRIRRAQDERLAAFREREPLPAIARAEADLSVARASVGQLAHLTVPTDLVEIPGGQLDDLERMQRQAQLALSAFQSKMAAVATLNIGGFDTHSDHDRDQARQVSKVLAGIDYVMKAASLYGVADRLYVVAASDFGRGPFYNSERDNGGKDHWPITSMLVMGPGVPGDRVIGATNAQQQARNIDPATLGAVDDGGVRLTPEVIHRSLRRLAGVDAYDADFPLAGEDVDLFG